MRCKACNVKLTNYESVAKDPQDRKQYLDLCTKCMGEVYDANGDWAWDNSFLDK